MTNTNTRTHREEKKKSTSIIQFKVAATLDPVLQEIKFQNGPQLQRQNKGA